MKKYRLKIPIFSNSNIVITEEITLNDFIFKPENKENEKGVIETFATNAEKNNKIEEVKDFLAILSLEISEARGSNFFIYPGEAQFFNVESYGKTQDGKKIPIFLAIGKEETCINGEFISRSFEKYKLVAKDERLIRGLRWYNFGKFSTEVADGIISFITSLEAISENKKDEDLHFKKEIEKIEEAIRKLKNIDHRIKERAINSIKNLNNLSFKEKVNLLINQLPEKDRYILLEKAKKLGLISNKRSLINLLGEIYKDRSKILHSGKKSVKAVSKKHGWLEICVRKILYNEINNLCLYPPPGKNN